MKNANTHSPTSFWKRCLDSYISFTVDNPWILLSIIIVITGFFGFKLTELKVDSTPYFMDGDHPERREEAVVRSQFTSTKEQAFVLVVAQGQDIYNRDTLTTIDHLSRAFESLSLVNENDPERLKSIATTDAQKNLVNNIIENGIEYSDVTNLQALLDSGLSEKSNKLVTDLIIRVQPVHKVRSLTQIENLQGVDGTLEVGPLIESVENTPAFFQALKSKIAENKLYHRILVSEDHKAANIQIEFNVPDYDSPNLVKTHEAVLAIINSHKTQDQIHFGGTPVVNAEIVHVLEKDNATFFPMVIVVIAVILYVSFRRAQGVFLPLLIAILSVVWSMGLMSLLGIRQNVVTTALPVFLITIAVADSIHYLSAYYQKLVQLHDKKLAIKKTMEKLFVALWLTSFTTMVGFYSLTITELVFVKEFGIVMIAGVFFAFVLTVALLPSVLQLTGKSAQNQQDVQTLTRRNVLTDVITSGVKSINAFALQKHKLLLVSLVLLSVILGYLNTQIRFDQHNTSSFDADTRLRIDDAVLNKHLGGTSPLNISFHASTPGAFTSVEVIRALDVIESHLLAKYSVLGYAASPADYLKRIHQVLTETTAYELPADMTSEQIAQYYLLYETSSGQEIRNVLDETYTHARIAILGHTDQASIWKEIIGESDSFIKANLPAGISYEFSGVGNIQKANLNEVISSQMKSLLSGAIFILIVMIFILRSLVLGLIAVVPLVLTLATLFAFMVMMNIHLDIGTGLIAALIFGIGVDYAIHFFTHFKMYYYQEGRDLEDSLLNTLTDVGAPIIINSLALAAGFLVLALSSFAPLAYLGIFVAGAMVICAFWVLLLVPLLLRTFLASRRSTTVSSQSIPNLQD